MTSWSIFTGDIDVLLPCLANFMGEGVREDGMFAVNRSCSSCCHVGLAISLMLFVLLGEWEDCVKDSGWIVCGICGRRAGPEEEERGCGAREVREPARPGGNDSRPCLGV